MGVVVERGQRQAGDSISTVMITGVHDIRVGQQSRQMFAGCGEVRLKITQAGPKAA